MGKPQGPEQISEESDDTPQPSNLTQYSEEDAFVELYGPSMQPLFDFSWLSFKALLSLALVGACITLGAYLGHK
ncbi:hypothetical protein MC885_001639 [Smutsia gigantea]|nr:hypothetical protein MC885_001639 [Smutsia gigantea]